MIVKVGRLTTGETGEFNPRIVAAVIAMAKAIMHATSLELPTLANAHGDTNFVAADYVLAGEDIRERRNKRIFEKSC